MLPELGLEKSVQGLKNDDERADSGYCREAGERSHNSIKEHTFRQYTVAPAKSTIRHLEQVNNNVPLAAVAKAVAGQVTCKVSR